MPAHLNDHARRALTEGRLAHLTTINDDGSPQISAVWTGLDGDEIVVAHLMGGRKVQNIAADPRVALSIETEGANAVGMAHHLVIRGEARLTEGGAPELLQQLARVYVGPDAVFPAMDDPPPGHVIHIRPTWIGGVGPWSA
jgi:PPOX class probable F420-dependent enzyme